MARRIGLAAHPLGDCLHTVRYEGGGQLPQPDHSLPQLGVGSTKGIDIWSGVTTGSTSFDTAFASPVWGRVADRHGRRLSLPRSSFAIALFTGLMGLSTNVWQFFGARAVTGAFAGFSSAAIALVASQVPERRLGHPLGWLASGQLVGSLIGQSSAVCWPMSPAAIVPRFSGVPALPAPAWHWSEPW